MGLKLRRLLRRLWTREERPSRMVLTVTEDTPADMLAGSMELLVQLPREHHHQTQRVTVQRSTPMMDLLVQIATAQKLAASSYTLQAIGERGMVLPHQPNTPIGALDALQVKLLPKQGTFVPRKTKQSNQPFETTFRLQVHLPRNQLYVSRVSPKMNLGEILEEVCREKNLDKNKYELRHPANLEETLDLSLSLQDYHLQEVTLYAKQGRTLGSALSTQDIMALQRQEERRRQQAKQGVFGFVFKKSKESSLSTDSLGGRSASPARSDETGRSTSPLQPPARPQRKRRPAPKPPTLAQAEVSNGSEENTGDSSKDKVVISHSRNSSDSSGYHEASVLSDNPDSAGRLPETLPRRNRLPIETPRKLAHTSQSSKSLSNLAFVPGTLTHGISSTSLSSAGLRKKRTAPPPPANRPLSSAISTQALERIVDSEESLTSDMEPSKPASDIGESEARPKASSDIGVTTVGAKLSPGFEPEPANPEPKACKLEVAPRHRAGSVNAKLPSDEPRNVAPVEDAPVDARVPRKRAGEPAPLPKPRKTSATGSTLVRPQVPKRKLAPPSPLSRTLSSSSSNVDRLPSTASEASSSIPCGTSVDSFESAGRSSVRSDGKPESGEKVDATSVCSTSEDEVFLTPGIDQSEACFDYNSITLEEKEEGSLKMVGNSGKESSNHEVQENGGQSAKSSTRSTPRQEKKLCAVISTVPKCAHLDLLAESGDLLSSVERGKKAQGEQSAEAKAGVDEVAAQNREPKRARIPRTASKSNDFETNTLEKQKRHLTSHAEDITFALNLNVTSNVGLRQKEERDTRCQDVSGGELHHGLGGSADTKLSQTDVLLQKVSDTLSNSLPVSPPSERVQKPEASSVSKKTEPSAMKKSVNQQGNDFQDGVIVSTSTPNLTVNSQQDTSDYVSAADEDLSIADWEYQLPAPPSAFRDTASPSFESFEEVAESPESFEDPEIKGQVEALHREPKDSSAKAPERQEPEKRTQEKPYRQLRSECSLKKEVICELENRISTLPQGAKDSDSRRSSDNSSTPKVAPVDNPLSNFTITTYSRQKNLNIFEEVEEQSRRKNADDRFVKSFATLSRNRSNSDELEDRGSKEFNAGTLQGKRRVNAEDEGKKLEPKTQTDTSQRWQAGNEKGNVQRSKSYASVCDKPEPQRDPPQEGVRNGGHAEEAKDAGVKKATSITSLNATAPTGNERFSQWREKILKRQEEPTKEKQLQSLQVLKSILPQLKNAQQAEENVPKESDDTVLPEKTRPETASTEHSVESSVVSARDSRPAPSSKDLEPGSKKPPPETSAKRYTYSGPPAISLGSWSERPSVNIQIKMDTDYKLGLKRASGRTIVNINGTRDEIDGSNCAEDSMKPRDKGKIEVAPSERREPNELARKLITHTTASGFKKPVLNRLASEAKPPGGEKPVVTGVELKKSFAEGSAVDTSPVNFKELTKAFGQDVCLRPKPKRSTLTRRSDVQVESDPGKLNGHCGPEKSNSSDQYLTNDQDTRPKRFTSVVGIHPQNQGNFPFRNGNLPVVKGFKISSAKLDQNQNREASKEPRNGVPKPPTMPVITGVTLKNARPKSMPVQVDQRDVLLESIRNFGGRENLKSATERC
ncbi:uncharacterized protein LOC143377105 isoform X3 [Andrena cerasifolii]|uniref:uncharacterized protein LOC143377105 isoform X3 n=1 Tax=Andrena cerasifolii TaxID=2819439 RepID=UPI00403811BE